MAISKTAVLPAPVGAETTTLSSLFTDLKIKNDHDEARLTIIAIRKNNTNKIPRHLPEREHICDLRLHLIKHFKLASKQAIRWS